MRVLLDANIVIGYLLSAKAQGRLQPIFQALFEDKFTLLLPEALLDEIIVTVSQKPHLTRRISVEHLQQTVALLQQIGEHVPRIESEIPAVSRDPKDDYLLAYAVVGQADYLVTGDKDLLDLRQVGEVTILSPAEFIQLL